MKQSRIRKMNCRNWEKVLYNLPQGTRELAEAVKSLIR